MNLLIIGHSVVDNIIYKGKKIIKPGGIFYAAAALAGFKEKSDTVFLCTSLSEDSANLFLPVYNLLNTDYLVYDTVIPKVNLIISDRDERTECYDKVSKPLNVNYSDLQQMNGVLINMISGFDITLEQIKNIRNNFDGLIYFDVHTFSRGIDDKGIRSFRKINNFNEWAECVDILQANKTEIKMLTDKLTEEETVEELFSFKIKQVIVTDAEKGAVVYLNDINTRKEQMPAINVIAINHVGCGDVFGAVYFYNYIQNKNVKDALTIANKAAGISTTYSSVNDYLNLKKDVFK